jgi:hypothetical protein
VIQVLCPTRGRPQKQMEEVVETFLNTSSGRAKLKFITEHDQRDNFTKPFSDSWVHYIDPQIGGMGGALNEGMKDFVTQKDITILGFIGDDHRFRSWAWDEEVSNALTNGGVAWAYDGVHGGDLPTQWFVSKDIASALGWLALPDCRHFYLDNAWADLAYGAECAYYLEHVLIEHMHFSFGKSELDDTYMYSMKIGDGDHGRYLKWRGSGAFERDLKIVRDVMFARRGRG